MAIAITIMTISIHIIRFSRSATPACGVAFAAVFVSIFVPGIQIKASPEPISFLTFFFYFFCVLNFCVVVAVVVVVVAVVLLIINFAFFLFLFRF